MLDVANSSSSFDSPLLGRIRIDRRRGSRHLRMRILGYQSVAVSAPLRASHRKILSFINKNHNWITNQPAWHHPLFTNQMRLTPNTRLRIEVGGAKSKSSVSDLTLSAHIPDGVSALSLEAQQHIYKIVIRYLRNLSEDFLPGRITELSAISGLHYDSLTLKNISSRWGSYSSKGNLNLAIQLMRLPDDLIDHVILHELCHSRHMGHSASFWNDFESMRPKCMSERRNLRQYQLWRRPC